MYWHPLFIALALSATAIGEEVCFENLECFPTGEPWSTYKRPVPPPEGPDIVKVNYHLYTRKSPNDAYIIKGDSDWTLRGSTFDYQKPTIFFMHGWKGSLADYWIPTVKDAILKSFDANLFMVDYGSQKDKPYIQSVSNARVVGALLARFIQFLIKYEGASPSRMHLIGVSLGAHVASYAAKRTPGIARLTGLDPAQPLFEGESKEVQFDATDAKFVDVAHTNGRPVLPLGGLGINWPIGHVDFYFNGGWNQPGCGIDALGSTLKDQANLYEVWPRALLCPHYRVMNYFIEAMGNPNCTFWGVRRQTNTALLNILSRGWLSKFLTSLKGCTLDTCTPFGPKTPEYPARGSFEIATNDKEPYCLKNKEVDAAMQQQLYRHQ